MDTRLNLTFGSLPFGRRIDVESIAYDAGDNSLTIVTIDPLRGLHLRSAFDYEDGRDTIAVIDNWRERGHAGQPEFRLLEGRLSIDSDALRRDCLYDHVARFMDFAALAGGPVTVDAVERAVAELNPSPLRRSPTY